MHVVFILFELAWHSDGPIDWFVPVKYLPRACMREGVKQLVLSVHQFVSLSVSPVKNF